MLVWRLFISLPTPSAQLCSHLVRPTTLYNTLDLLPPEESQEEEKTGYLATALLLCAG
jgi:hypothetical protein